ncbi:UNVERIFIED_CONTAM: efflux RND transporter permease subunit, partial [Salmonella enterica subsp. enterica serovar Weltevreden]
MASGLLESIDRSTQLAGHNRLALLLFRLGPRQVFGINVFKGQEVIRRPQLSLLPSSHPLVSGIADIREVIVGSAQGQPIRIRDLAEVGLGQELRTGAATDNGREVVLGTVFMLIGENSRTVSRAVDQRMAEINRGLP